MDKLKNNKTIRFAAALLIAIVLFGAFSLSHRHAEASNSNVPKNQGSKEAIVEKQQNQQEKQSENKGTSGGSTETEPSKTDKDIQNTGSNQEQGKITIKPPTPVDSNDSFAVFNNTLFIGDSRTEGFRLYSGVKNATYFCLKAMTVDEIVEGKTVNMSGQTLSVYDMLDSGTYDKVIIAVGLNELGWNHIETFLQEYGLLIDNIKQKQPDAVIYLQAILPVSREKDASDKVHNNAQVYWYNTNIVQLADSKGVIYINPASAVVDADGFLLNEATTDGIHLNSDYCKKLAAYMADMI